MMVIIFPLFMLISLISPLGLVYSFLIINGALYQIVSRLTTFLNAMPRTDTILLVRYIKSIIRLSIILKK